MGQIDPFVFAVFRSNLLFIYIYYVILELLSMQAKKFASE